MWWYNYPWPSLVSWHQSGVMKNSFLPQLWGHIAHGLSSYTVKLFDKWEHLADWLTGCFSSWLLRLLEIGLVCTLTSIHISLFIVSDNEELDVIDEFEKLDEKLLIASNSSLPLTIKSEMWSLMLCPHCPHLILISSLSIVASCIVMEFQTADSNLMIS